MSKYVIFAGPYFPVFGPQKTPYWDTLHAVHLLKKKTKQRVQSPEAEKTEGNYQTK